MAQQILMVPEHANIVTACEANCLQAVTYAEDNQAFRASQLLTSAYKNRNKFPVGTYAHKLCQHAIDLAEERIIGEE